MDPAAEIEQEALAYVKPIDEATERGDSDIQRFYQDATVFFTGGTGFIGKQLVEKLFRSCDLKKAFVLIRPKKGQSTKERLKVMLSDPVFELVRKNKPDIETRIVCVEGDVADIRLGISDEIWNTLVDEVNVIFHVAASVRFDDNICTATLTNVRGTREMLRLGKACKNIRSFIHISTAYCHATLSRVGNEIFEQFYESPVPPETMIQLAETVDTGRLDTITSSLTTGWPNTYTFTKAIAEALIQDEAGNLPVCIIRPSVVVCTYREPVPGWLDLSCMYGPSGILLGVILGVRRVLLVDSTAKMSFVPLDFVNNATIAAGWETAVKRTTEINIYHISSTKSGVTFKHISVPVRKVMNSLKTPRAIWSCYLIETSNRIVYSILTWLLHYIPAYAVDALVNVLKLKKPLGLKSFIHVYDKFDKMSSVFNYFLTNEWNLDDSNLYNLWQKMSAIDKKIYNFEINSIDWDHYSYMWLLGTRKYIIKDGLKGTREAVAWQKWFKLSNYLIFMIYLYVFWQALSCIWYIFKCMF